MPRPITRNQMADLWYDEFRNRDNGFCILCGNHGIINTIGRVFTPAGTPCGGEALCICPNGRAIMRQLTKKVGSHA